MASKDDWSSGLDWRQVVDMIWAFEKQNRVAIEVTMKVVVVAGQEDLLLEAKAWDTREQEPGVKLLVSANVRCLVEKFKSLLGVITFLLYQLDFQLAEQEWARIKELPM